MHVGIGRQRRNETVGDGARVEAGGLGQKHRGVRRQVAMRGVARRLDRQARQIEIAALFGLQTKGLHGFLDPLVEIGENIHEQATGNAGKAAGAARAKRPAPIANRVPGQTGACIP